jgi:sodium pump decarboxylase gamma subunit
MRGNMKKLFTLLCMIACIFLLPQTAQAQETLTTYQQQKIEAAETTADNLMNVLVTYADTQELQDQLSELTGEEIQYVLGNNNQVNADGNAFKTAVSSFASAKDAMGAVIDWSVASSEIDGNRIIVRLDVTGEKENAQAEIIVSNDMFCVLQSAALNPTSSMGARMVTAALNTAIGLTTVFSVLIIIIILISCFTFIPKIQASFSKKNEASVSTNETAQIRTEEPSLSAVVEEVADETEDEELVAVIAAAIAASEGMVSPEGLVVRSIRRVKRS